MTKLIRLMSRVFLLTGPRAFSPQGPCHHTILCAGLSVIRYGADERLGTNIEGWLSLCTYAWLNMEYKVHGKRESRVLEDEG